MGTVHSKKEKINDTSTPPVKKSFSNAGKIYSSCVKGKKSSTITRAPSDDIATAINLSYEYIAPENMKDITIFATPSIKTVSSKSIEKTNSNSTINDSSSTMKYPRKINHRRTLPKTVPLKDQNRFIATNTTINSINKGTLLKSLPDQNGKSSVEKSSASSQTSVKVKTKSSSRNEITPKINPLMSQLKYATDGMEAFIIMFQRLTSDVDVFVLPHIKQELSKYKKDWLEMKLKLDEANASCSRLKEDIDVQRILREQKLIKLRDAHTIELNRLNENHKRELTKYSVTYETRLKELENELKNKEEALRSNYEIKLQSIRDEAEHKLESILNEAKRQVELLKVENKTWKEKLTADSCGKLREAEEKFRNKMRIVETDYENRLNEAQHEVRKREELFLSLSKKMKKKSSKINENDHRRVKTNNYCQNIEDEICSLRTVLDLKHSEIQELRKQNEKLRKEAQDLPFLAQKLDVALARIEDLNAQLQTKIDSERKLFEENRKLVETVQQENEKKKRLTFKNEELLWKLKKSTQVAQTLAEFNGNRTKTERVSESEASFYHSTPSCIKQYSSFRGYTRRNGEKCLRRSRTEDDIKFVDSFNNDDNVSPKVLGVVEKSDSVSWVLEIDESPVTVASRMLRRANSLRGVPSKWRNATAKNQQSLTLPIRIRNSTCSSNEPANLAVNRKRLSLDSVEKLGKDDTKKMDENAIVDIEPFFNFLHDSPLDGSDSSEIEKNVKKKAKSATSSSSSFSSSPRSSSSLELDEDEQITRSKSTSAHFGINSIESIDEKRSQEMKYARFESSKNSNSSK